MFYLFKFKRYLVYFFVFVYDLFYYTINFFKNLRFVKKYFKEVIIQIEYIGVNSFPLVVLTSAFIGMVATIQTAYQIKDYVPVIYIGSGVAKAVMIELGPVITGLVVAGRISSGIAAELGSMVITEQVDALKVMGISPHRFLVMPRVLAGIIALPLLTVIADFIAIFSGMGISHFTNIAHYTVFSRGAKLFFLPKDLWGGLLKSIFFGYLLTFSGTLTGLKTERGAEGVGRSTTRAVVIASLLILFFDYILGIIIFG